MVTQSTHERRGRGGVRLPASVHLTSPFARLASYLMDGMLFAVTLGVGWLIWAAFTARHGQTPGKQVLGQRVISTDLRQPVGLGRMLGLRGLVGGFVAAVTVIFTLGVILFMPFWDSTNQNIWDKVSDCYVVNDPEDAWHTRRGA